jgi:hypothetical protein
VGPGVIMLGEIAKKLKNEKGYEEIKYCQVVRGVPTNFISCEVKGLFFWKNILWIDLGEFEEDNFCFWTKDPQIDAIVREVATSYGIKCREVFRDHFPPVGSY